MSVRREKIIWQRASTIERGGTTSMAKVGEEVELDDHQVFVDVPLSETPTTATTTAPTETIPKEGQRPNLTQHRHDSVLWTGLRSQWRKHGVVEIGPNHRRYEILCCINEAIKDLVLNHPELGPKDTILPEDFHHVLEQSITGCDGKTFKFRSYASGLFATLRCAIGLDEHSYMQSLSPEDLPYMEFVSNSKGGRDFFLTNDKAYFMKTEKKYYVKVFLDLLDDYLNHFLKHPHSLIVKYLGLYSIKVPSEDTMYFYVMQSIYHPDDRINVRYDVKGCLAGRYQEPPEKGSKVMTVLKDKNFIDNKEVIKLGPQKQWFLDQLALDIGLMKRLHVQDYSLLIAYYPLQRDERKVDFGDVAVRIKKSLGPKRTTSSGTELDLGAGVSTEQLCEGTDSSPANNVDAMTASRPINGKRQTLRSSSLPVITHIEPGSMNVHADDDADLLDFVPSKQAIREVNERLKMSFVNADYLDLTEAENRRLLPKAMNALHVIDGPYTRYHIGLIDFFTLYECRQRVGRIIKNVQFKCADHSTIPPPAYGDRLYNFIAEHVE